MADITECPVCFEEYKDPKLLPCNHTLCLECLENLVKEEHVTCPMCNAKHKVPDRGVKAFTENQHAVQLIAYSQKLKEYERRLKIREEIKGVTDAIGEATVEEDPQTEKLKTTDLKQDETKKLDDSELKDNSEKGAEAPIATHEINEAETMVTAHEQHENGDGNREIDTPSVRPKEKRKYTPIEKAALLAHCRQRLASIEGEYNPERCSNCGKREEELGKDQWGKINEMLKSCTKCKTARYCSRKCQATDWKGRHKNHCDEMHKLRTIIQHESYINTYGSHEVKHLKVTLDGEPYTVAGEKMAQYMSLHEDKQVIQYLQGEFIVTTVYNTNSGSEEAVICQKRKRDMFNFDLCGVEFVQSSGSLHIASALRDVSPHPPFLTYSIEFWPYPDHTDKPAYIYKTNGKMFGFMSSLENILLISNEKEQTIEEWDATSFPIKPTGRVIPTGESRTSGIYVHDICVRKRHNKNLLLLRCRHSDRLSLKCLDFTGHVLWFTNQTINAGAMCTDSEGHVYVHDKTEGDKVYANLNELSFQPLFSCPGGPASIAWCNKTNRMIVVHETFGGGFVTARLAIEKIGQNEEDQDGSHDEETENIEEHGKGNTTTKQSNALTFYRQKLALIQCGYDPKSCTCCGKCGPVRTLMACIKCKTAFYCSKECQVKDWKPRHKAHCKEIQRLKERIKEDESGGKNILLKASPARQPFKLKASQMCPTQMFVYKETQFVCGMDGLTRYNSVGKVLAKYKLRIDSMGKPERCYGLCVFNIGVLPYIVLSFAGERGRLEIWSWPLKYSSTPDFTYDANGSVFSPLCLFEGRLYAANVHLQTVQEFDISCIQIKPTGVNIPTIKKLEKMCVFRQDGEKRLLYVTQCSPSGYGVEQASMMYCIDFKGMLVWQLGDGKTFQPKTVRVDKEGRIFAIDGSSRVATVNKNLSIQTVFQHEGTIVDISFCDGTNKLYVIHAMDATHDVYCSSAFDIVAEDRP